MRVREGRREREHFITLLQDLPNFFVGERSEICKSNIDHTTWGYLSLLLQMKDTQEEYLSYFSISIFIDANKMQASLFKKIFVQKNRVSVSPGNNLN